jgi:hypothetical protein
MNVITIPESGIFIPDSVLPERQGFPGPRPGAAPLPVSATMDGWPTWIAGIHQDGTPNWYCLFVEADPEAGTSARYKRQYPPPAPPEPPPSKLNPDGIYLWVPQNNQTQGSCRFDPVPYD